MYKPLTIQFNKNLELFDKYKINRNEKKLICYNSAVEALCFYYNVKCIDYDNIYSNIYNFKLKKIYDYIFINNINYNDYDIIITKNEIKELEKMNLIKNKEIFIYSKNKLIKNKKRIFNKKKYLFKIHNIISINNNIKFDKEIIYKFNIIRRTTDTRYNFYNYINKYQLFKNIKNEIKNNYNIDNKMITNAWLKMFEILNNYKLIDLNNKNIKTFSVCEAPGSFISAINQYINSNNKNIKWKWIAQSLISSEALGDDFNLMKKYKKNWLNVNNGDLMNINNILYYKQKLFNSIDFFTSDSGVNTKPKRFMHRYIDLSKLNFAQSITSLFTLKINGNCVHKIWLPLFNKGTLSWLYIMYLYFDELIFCKPTTSSHVSDEIYLIGKKFKGIDNKNCDFLIKNYNNYYYNKKFIDYDNDKKFISLINNANNKLCDNVINTFEMILHNYDKKKFNNKKINKYKKLNCEKWLKNNKIFNLDDKYKL